MKRIIPFVLLLGIVSACEKNEPEQERIFEEFYTSTSWKTDNSIEENKLTGEMFAFEKYADREYWKSLTSNADMLKALMVPQERLSGMSTQNLARTCTVYPFNITYMAFVGFSTTSIDGIFHIMNNFNGYTQIQRRPSGPQELLKIYMGQKVKMDGKHEGWSADFTQANSFMDISAMELVLATAVDAGRFTNDEIADMIHAMWEKNEDFVESGLYSWNGAICYCYVLGATIAYHYAPDLSQNEITQLKAFVLSGGDTSRYSGDIGTITKLVADKLNSMN
ncbi:MAG: hypothetical protein WC395_03460 [Bacteroidales bacterium]|jgi:hypothetical protein